MEIEQTMILCANCTNCDYRYSCEDSRENSGQSEGNVKLNLDKSNK